MVAAARSGPRGMRDGGVRARPGAEHSHGGAARCRRGTRLSGEGSRPSGRPGQRLALMEPGPASGVARLAHHHREHRSAHGAPDRCGVAGGGVHRAGDQRHLDGPGALHPLGGLPGGGKQPVRSAGSRAGHVRGWKSGLPRRRARGVHARPGSAAVRGGHRPLRGWVRRDLSPYLEQPLRGDVRVRELGRPVLRRDASVLSRRRWASRELPLRFAPEPRALRSLPDGLPDKPVHAQRLREQQVYLRLRRGAPQLQRRRSHHPGTGRGRVRDPCGRQRGELRGLRPPLPRCATGGEACERWPYLFDRALRVHV